ncbi:putative NagC family transcriptional regulator [Gordonia araii NBRC 100433]|uniref:Putative NagC family transcriptional regulator n=1 Tax=Gordonia araii NBRC 100433 TaxID=1073574 RepID=G7H6X5_9ACTN|nr:ROK family transcriptional regulator [Gordonia araii]NNG96017.1 ROK family transcriptional regulator [Gordonia araii NBRC 100433]GAB11600.1 putative NagC family transcriptional regulator [Gordonia araii NBRC 100433]
MTSILDRPVTTTRIAPPRRVPHARSPRPVGAPVPARAPRRPADLHVTTPDLALSDKPAAQVLRAVRLAAPVFRDEIAESTGLSISTVNRQVGALLKAGLIRERSDLAPSGAVGRPRLPVEISVAEHLTIGVHIGYKVTSITAHDLLHRVVGAISVPTPADAGAENALTALAHSVSGFLARWRNREIRWVGVAVGGRVHDGGVVDHPRLGWSQAEVGRIFAQTLGYPVSVASHVEAMAAAELVANPEQRASFLYFYAREMVGVAFSVDGSVHTPSAGPPVIGHFPIGPTRLLDPHRTGQLEAATSDTGIVAAARAAGLELTEIADLHEAARDGNEIARDILTERAEVLGRAVALISDIFNPDHVVLGGQAFTDAPQTLPVVARTIRDTSVTAKRDVRVSRAGVTVQQQAAGAISLDALYTDPLGAIAITD